MTISVTEMNKIWDRVTKLLKDNGLDAHIYDSFFLGSYIYSVEGETMAISVSSGVAAKIITEKYKNVVEDAVSQITESRFKLVFISETDIGDLKPVAQVPTSNDKREYFDSNFLNENYTFDNFIVGPCNIEAKQASLFVATTPGREYNPLFIYSASGLGKTHLLHAIGNHIKSQHSRLKVLYLTTDNFVDEFVRSIQGQKEIDDLRDYFKTVDVLLVDDIQFLADKTKTADMFFNIFNSMINSNKQIILTSDRSPNELRGLEARLVTRFKAGLSINIKNPDHETLLSILKQKIESHDLELESFDDEVLEFIVEHFSTSVRDLEGAVNKILFYSVTHQPAHFSMNVALDAISPLINISEQQALLNEEKILSVVADYYNLSVAQLKGNSRQSQLSMARHIAMYLIRTILDLPFKQIGKVLGGKDHSTVMTGVNKVEKMLKTNHQYSTAIEELKKRLSI
ncbi:MAG: chromosomal replication initiator protein DnaA [Bacilli bacterium]|nr:chromosomal replication initiator protein DnaA [Bacilli bacterium]